jgi:hypothetical protein
MTAEGAVGKVHAYFRATNAPNETPKTIGRVIPRALQNESTSFAQLSKVHDSGGPSSVRPLPR